MGRYDTTKIIKVKDGPHDGKIKKNTKFYKKIPESNNDVYVQTVDGDRLDQLAFQYYGDQHLWWYIARANNLKFNNIKAGTVLRIPITTEFVE